MAPGMEIELAIQAHGIPSVWPQDVIAEAAVLPARKPVGAFRGG